ncbi:MAG: hypothetical protein ACRD7E_02210 [Bryobacteraceae bacterium]
MTNSELYDRPVLQSPEDASPPASQDSADDLEFNQAAQKRGDRERYVEMG